MSLDLSKTAEMKKAGAGDLVDVVLQSQLTVQ